MLKLRCVYGDILHELVLLHTQLGVASNLRPSGSCSLAIYNCSIVLAGAIYSSSTTCNSILTVCISLCSLHVSSFCLNFPTFVIINTVCCIVFVTAFHSVAIQV